jgi:hypothetical protein
MSSQGRGRDREKGHKRVPSIRLSSFVQKMLRVNLDTWDVLVINTCTGYVMHDTVKAASYETALTCAMERAAIEEPNRPLKSEYEVCITLSCGQRKLWEVFPTDSYQSDEDIDEDLDDASQDLEDAALDIRVSESQFYDLLVFEEPVFHKVPALGRVVAINEDEAMKAAQATFRLASGDFMVRKG